MLAGRTRVAKIYRLAVDTDRTGIWHDDAGHDLDERALSRSVIADERRDAAGREPKADAFERGDAPEGLRDAVDLKRDGTRTHHPGEADRGSAG